MFAKAFPPPSYSVALSDRQLKRGHDCDWLVVWLVSGDRVKFKNLR
jgi:hypothetical protein